MEDLTKNPQSEDIFTNEQNDNNPETTNPEQAVENVSGNLHSDANNSEHSEDLILSDLDFSSLYSAGGWMKFNGVFGLILAGIFLLVAIFVLFVEGGPIGIYYFIWAAFTFYTSWQLYKSGYYLQKAKHSTKIKDKIDSLVSGFRYTENFWAITGLISILTLGIMVMAIVGLLVFTLSR